MSIASAELPPAVFDLPDVGHVGQRAAGGQVGQNHRHPPPAALGKPLGPIGQDVGRFGHEVDAAEGDGPALFVFGRQIGQLVAVAAQIGQGDHVVLLIMVAEDQQPRAHFTPHPLDALGEHRRFPAIRRATDRKSAWWATSLSSLQLYHLFNKNTIFRNNHQLPISKITAKIRKQ